MSLMPCAHFLLISHVRCVSRSNYTVARTHTHTHTHVAFTFPHLRGARDGLSCVCDVNYDQQTSRADALWVFPKQTHALRLDSPSATACEQSLTSRCFPSSPAKMAFSIPFFRVCISVCGVRLRTHCCACGHAPLERRVSPTDWCEVKTAGPARSSFSACIPTNARVGTRTRTHTYTDARADALLPRHPAIREVQ